MSEIAGVLNAAARPQDANEIIKVTVQTTAHIHRGMVLLKEFLRKTVIPSEKESSVESHLVGTDDFVR
jgi:hypothetical protein